MTLAFCLKIDVKNNNEKYVGSSSDLITIMVIDDLSTRGTMSKPTQQIFSPSFLMQRANNAKDNIQGKRKKNRGVFERNAR